MSALFRNIFRHKFWMSSGRQSHKCPTTSFSPPNDYHDGGYKIYKRLALLVGLPIVLAAAAMVYLKRKQCEPERVPFAKYEYMRLRSKRFPWGDGNHSLFHNPKYNALPDGYEVELNEKCEEEEVVAAAAEAPPEE